jgi:hypothetical protein
VTPGQDLWSILISHLSVAERVILDTLLLVLIMKCQNTIKRAADAFGVDLKDWNLRMSHRILTLAVIVSLTSMILADLIKQMLLVFYEVTR